MTDYIQTAGRVDRQKHTPEPWEVINSRNITASDYKFVATTGRALNHETPTDKANAARIVACVNAMAGIEDPETWMKTTKEVMEGNLKLQANWSNVIEQLRQDREELLSALRTAHVALDENGYNNPTVNRVIAKHQHIHKNPTVKQDESSTSTRS